MTERSPAERSTEHTLELESWPPATGLRKPESAKVPGRALGRVAAKRALLRDCQEQCQEDAFFEKAEKRHCSQQPPSSALFPALFPALSPALLRIWVSSVLWQAAEIPSLECDELAFKKNALGVKRPFSELWERSRA